MRRPRTALTARARAGATLTIVIAASLVPASLVPASLAAAALAATPTAGATEPAAPTPPANAPTAKPAPGPPTGPTRTAIEARLQKAPGGPSPSEQGEIAREAPRVLVQIAGDRAARLSLRARAMTALAYAHTAEAHDFLENFVIRYMPTDAAAERQLLRKAAIALGWQAGGRTVEILALLLDHEDPDVRIDAAVALGLTRTRAADKPLRARLDRETDAGVRAQLESQIKTLAPAAETRAR